MALRRGASASSLGARAAKAAVPKAAAAPDDGQALNQQKAQKERLSNLAKKVPEVKRGGSESDYDRDCLVRNALVHAIDLLEKNPDYTMDCWSWLDQKINGGRCVDDGKWDESYTSWAKEFGVVPKYWIAQWLNMQYPELLSDTVLDKYDTADRDSVRRIFSLVTMVMPYDPLPKPCLDKQVMTKVLDARREKINFPMKKFLEECPRASGTIDWAKGYPFALSWGEDGLVTEVTNMFGEVHKMERHECVTDSFVLSHAYDPRQAMVAKGGTKIVLADLFPADSQLKQCQLDKKAKPLQDLAEAAAAEVAEEATKRAKGVVNEETIILKDTALVASRKRAAAAARERQSQNKLLRLGAVNLNDLAQAQASEAKSSKDK